MLNTSQMSKILFTRIELTPGRYRLECEWKGESNLAPFSMDFLEEILQRDACVGMDFWLNQLHLVVVDADYNSMMYVCALVDGRAYQMICSRRVYNLLDNIYRRVILTLHVWGLAYVPLGEIPQWQHIGKRIGAR